MCLHYPKQVKKEHKQWNWEEGTEFGAACRSCWRWLHVLGFPSAQLCPFVSAPGEGLSYRLPRKVSKTEALSCCASAADFGNNHYPAVPLLFPAPMCPLSYDMQAT